MPFLYHCDGGALVPIDEKVVVVETPPSIGRDDKKPEIYEITFDVVILLQELKWRINTPCAHLRHTQPLARI